jgi:high-affinity nickel-transport protein
MTIMFGCLLAFNLVVWAGILAASRSYAVLIGSATLAYGFGLRHAVDPDHIAAIDNTTRKLMQDGKRPVGVGLFFSLGHSSVVVALSATLALSASFVRHDMPQLKSAGGVLGSSVSAAFLLVIGLINLVVLIDILRVWRQVRLGNAYDEGTLDSYLANRGLIARLLRPLLKMVRKSWHMYPIGVLFGLGFDTASEVGLLALSAIAGANGLPFWAIILLPLCFTAGMALVDSLDGVLMLGAYGWAFVRPVRKLYYNLSITMISVLIALFIGGVEALQTIGRQSGASGGVWSIAGRLDLQNMGFVIIAGFVAAWFVSLGIYRLRGYDRLDDASRVTVSAVD